jgi:hypothetical protein
MQLRTINYITKTSGSWVARLVARLLATTALWIRIQTSLKIKMCDISKGVANTHSSPPKKYTEDYFKKIFSHSVGTWDQCTVVRFWSYPPNFQCFSSF